MVSGWEWQDMCKDSMGVNSGLGIKSGRFFFSQKYWCSSSRLACCLGQKVWRCVKTKCFGGEKYIFVFDQLYICV